MQEISQGRLRYFHEVVACGSVRRGREAGHGGLGGQPPDPAAGEGAGRGVFERRSRGLTPTEAADMLLEYYRACRAQQEHLGARLQELRGMQRGSVQLMISEGFIDSLMEHVVGPFCIEHPRINISVNVGSVNEVVEAVASDAAHIGLACQPAGGSAPALPRQPQAPGLPVDPSGPCAGAPPRAADHRRHPAVSLRADVRALRVEAGGGSVGVHRAHPPDAQPDHHRCACSSSTR